MGLQCGDKSGTGGSQAAGAGPPSQPHVQDKLLPTQGTGVAQPGTSGKEGRDAERGLQECAMGTLRHPLRPGRGLLPPRPAGLPAEQINLSSTSKARTGLPKALCSVQSGGVQGQLGSRAASPLPLRTGTSPEPQHPNPQLCPRHCPGASLLSATSQRENPAHAGPWHRHQPDNFRGRAGARPDAAPAPDSPPRAGSVCSLSSHLGSKMCPSISGHTSPRGLSLRRTTI